MTGQRPSNDGPAQLHFSEVADVDRFVSMLSRFEAGEIGADEWRAFRLVHGTYGQRQEGDLSMLRVKLPQGAVSSEQLRVAADVAERWSRGFLHLTTRQNFQFHFMKLAEVELAMRAFADVGVTTREACGNSVRNITTSPTAGVAHDEIFDVTPYARALTRYLLRHPLSASLPRKFKIAFSGGGADHAFAVINDIGWTAAVRDGKPGFRVTLAGGTATLTSGGYVFRDFMPANDMFRVAEAVVRVFHRLGDRVHRHKNRMKFLVRALGWPKFLAEVEAELASITEPLDLPFDPDNAPSDPPPRRQLTIVNGAPEIGVDRPREPFPPHLASVLGASSEDEWRSWNVSPQKQAGYSLVLVHLPLGDITSSRLRFLADIAERFSDGTLRATHDQNFLLRWVRNERVGALYAALAKGGLSRARHGGLDDVVSCPGAESCKLAVTRSRDVAALVHRTIENRPDLAERGRNLTVHVSGCPNGCGLHHVSSIGLQGGMRKVGGRPVPQYFVYAGGGFEPGGKARFGKVVAKVPARRVPQAIERLLDIHASEAQPGESFESFVLRLEPKVIKAKLADLEELSEATAQPEDFLDVGATETFEVTAAEGECVA